MVVPKILSVKPKDNKQLMVIFVNGQVKIYDCMQLLNREMFQLLNNETFFRNVKVDSGGYGIVWDDNIDLSEYELWVNGKELPVAN
jgi:hypothetical protein